MTDAESKNLLRQLEQATSAERIAPTSLDDETLQLRENWLALGKLLKAAESAPQDIQVAQIRCQTNGANWSAWRQFLATVAAVVAVALWGCFQIGLFQAKVASRRGMTKDSELQPGILPSPSSVHPPNSQPQIPQPSISQPQASQFAWEDGWDNALAQTTVVVQQFHGESTVRDPSFSRLEDQFRELARDFDSGSL